jgi:hypothetical protein
VDGYAIWPVVREEDWCGEHAPIQPATLGGLPALRAAMAPFKRAAGALIAAGQVDEHDIIFLDVTDPDGAPIGVSMEEIVALSVAFENLEG